MSNREVYTHPGKYGTIYFYGEAGRLVYEEVLRKEAEDAKPQPCAFCPDGSATQRMVGTGRRVCATCIDDLGVPTALLEANPAN